MTLSVFGVPMRSFKTAEKELAAQGVKYSVFPDLSKPFVLVIGVDLGIIAYTRMAKKYADDPDTFHRLILILDVPVHFTALRIPMLGCTIVDTDRYVKSEFRIPKSSEWRPFKFNKKLNAFRHILAAAKYMAKHGKA